MDNCQPSKLAANRLTQSQEDLSPPLRLILDASVKAMIDRFSHYRPKVIAKFIILAGETEMEQRSYGLLEETSPLHSTLFDNFHIINQLTAANPETAKELKLEAAEQYVNDSTIMGTKRSCTRQIRLSNLTTTSRRLDYDKSNSDNLTVTTTTSTRVLADKMSLPIPDGPERKRSKLHYRPRA